MRKAIFYQDEGLVTENLEKLKRMKDKEGCKLLVQERDEFEYVINNHVGASTFNMNLAASIRKFRKNAKLTLSQLEALTGIRSQALSQIERVDRTVNSYNLFKLAKVFGVTIDMLIGIENEADSNSKVKKIDELSKLAFTLPEEKIDTLLSVAVSYQEQNKDDL